MNCGCSTLCRHLRALRDKCEMSDAPSHTCTVQCSTQLGQRGTIRSPRNRVFLAHASDVEVCNTKRQRTPGLCRSCCRCCARAAAATLPFILPLPLTFAGFGFRGGSFRVVVMTMLPGSSLSQNPCNTDICETTSTAYGGAQRRCIALVSDWQWSCPLPSASRSTRRVHRPKPGRPAAVEAVDIISAPTQVRPGPFCF